MNSVLGRSDYRVKLDDFYDELINQIDVFVESNIQINKSIFIESSLTKQRDYAVAALNEERNSSLIRLDQLFEAKTKEAERNEGIVLIGDNELHNNSTLILILDFRFLQLGLIKLVDKWLSKHQVDMFKLLFMNDRPPITSKLTEFDPKSWSDVEFETIDEDKTQAYMDNFFINYKFSYESIILLGKSDFDQFLHTVVYQSDKIVEVTSSELFKINRLEFKEPVGIDGQPIIMKPEATFLFEYTDFVYFWFRSGKIFDAKFILTILDSFKFKNTPEIELLSFKFSSILFDQNAEIFGKFKGTSIKKMSLLMQTSHITSRFFYGLDQLHTLRFTNPSELYRFDSEILVWLPNLRNLILDYIEVDLFEKPFINHKSLEELSFKFCSIVNDQISPNVFSQQEGLKKLRFSNSSTTTAPNFRQLFGSLVHDGIKSMEIISCELFQVEEWTFPGMPNLTDLSLVSNSIKKISTLQNSAMLESLNLSKNIELSDLRFLASATKLSKLCLSASCVISLAFLSNMDLINLEELKVDNNNFEPNVVIDLTKMVKLESLDLDACGLINLPFRGSIPSLKKLMLANNCFEQIKQELFADVSMPNLIYLDVSGNTVKSVEVGAFSSMPKLESLVLEPSYLGIEKRVHEWPSASESKLNGLISLKEIYQCPEYTMGLKITKYKIFVSSLNKYVWVILDK